METTMNFWYFENVVILILYVTILVVPYYIAEKITNILINNIKSTNLKIKKYRDNIHLILTISIGILGLVLVNIFYY